ncbi:hypothetical protein CEUSTIGMA_g7990.t1 [Chlamydomonas eustigma]|uniref:Uncharacterized protein n=1 Tax=Chlamydomonas eustigma TaxID=1157962 RepID=A0A250XBU4_9CHLO|nr:hypothetical protein CEUSTIGMA_g7990.t1 [Chlamydomonas eustigma]|eukprot:GAX80553.1 hypothetical protein CEUSTIGMA_g7990.t1 [Chlamydomonas eustigma]
MKTMNAGAKTSTRIVHEYRSILKNLPVSISGRCPDVEQHPQLKPYCPGKLPRRRVDMRLQDVSLSSLSDSGIGAATEFVDRRLMVKLSLASSSGRLDLTDWRLTQLTPEIFDIEGLEELSLAGNCLTSLPSEIGRLTSLKRLQLAGNLLTAIPSSIRNLTNLEGLWLGGNLLEILPEEVGALTSLKQLILSVSLFL